MLHDMQSSIKPLSSFGVFLHVADQVQYGNYQLTVVCTQCGLTLAYAVRK